jgi:hypothetical protein
MKLFEEYKNLISKGDLRQQNLPYLGKDDIHGIGPVLGVHVVQGEDIPPVRGELVAKKPWEETQNISVGLGGGGEFCRVPFFVL